MTISIHDVEGSCEITSEVVTWLDAVDVFINCLRGMGYQIAFDNEEAVEMLDELHEASKA